MTNQVGAVTLQIGEFVVELSSGKLFEVKFVFDNGDLAGAGFRNNAVLKPEACRLATEAEKNLHSMPGRSEMVETLKAGDIVVAYCPDIQGPRMFQLFCSWSGRRGDWRSVDERSPSGEDICYTLPFGSIIRIADPEEVVSGKLSPEHLDLDSSATETACFFALYH